MQQQTQSQNVITNQPPRNQELTAEEQAQLVEMRKWEEIRKQRRIEQGIPVEDSMFNLSLFLLFFSPLRFLVKESWERGKGKKKRRGEMFKAAYEWERRLMICVEDPQKEAKDMKSANRYGCCAFLSCLTCSVS